MDETQELAAKKAIKKLRKIKRDAKRWRFTQKDGYFEVGPFDNDGDFIGCSVGIQKPNMTINASILGTGDTLKEAIDNAIECEKQMKGITL